MKTDFTHADAIKTLEHKLAEAVTKGEITAEQVLDVKPLLLIILNPQTSIDEKTKIADLIEQKANAGVLSEDQAIGLLFTVVNLEVEALNSSLETTIEKTRNTLARIEIGHIPAANIRPI